MRYLLLLLLTLPVRAERPAWLSPAQARCLRGQPLAVWIPTRLPQGSRLLQVYARRDDARSWHAYTLKFACGSARWSIEASGGGIGDIPAEPLAQLSGRHPRLGPFSIWSLPPIGSAYNHQPTHASPWIRLNPAADRDGFVRIWGSQAMRPTELRAALGSLRPL